MTRHERWRWNAAQPWTSGEECSGRALNALAIPASTTNYSHGTGARPGPTTAQCVANMLACAAMDNWFGWVCLVGSIGCTIAALVGAAMGAVWLLPFALLSAFVAFIVGYELVGER